jgi:glycosyltransferase involved in cell wall biosynthesis
MDGVDVVIPARNEENTIGDIVRQFVEHPGIREVIVGIDADTTDNTAMAAAMAGAGIRVYGARGKGQCVTGALMRVETPYVVFCDADVTGLTYDHISLLIAGAILGERTVTIGVPDIPSNYPDKRVWAWRWVSGQRCVPTSLVRILDLHGYLMETQINRASQHAEIPIRFEWLRGLKSKFQMSEVRIAEMERDAEWARQKGIL